MDAFLDLARAIAGLLRGIVDLIAEIVHAVSFGMYRSAERKRTELARESKVDTTQVFQQNTQLFKTGGFPSLDDFMEGVYTRLCEDINEGKSPFPHYEVRSALLTACGDLYIAEGLHKTPPSPPNTSDEIQLARYRDQMNARMRKASDPHTLEIMDKRLRESLEGFIAYLTPMTIDTTGQDANVQAPAPMIGLFSIIPDAAKALEALTVPLFAPDALNLDLFRTTRLQITANAERLGISSTLEYEGSAQTLATELLRDTPFAALAVARIPIVLPEETRFAGHWLIAPPGRGKTTLLHTMVIDDLANDAAIVLMDSKGDLIEPIKNLAAIKDRLLLIEPDPDLAFALNPLDVGKANPMHAVTLIEYIMAGLLDAKFTALQSTLFRNVIPAIIEGIPNPTLDTFKQVMVKGLPPEVLSKLNPHARDFFTDRDTGFSSKTYESTRKEVVWRLDYLLTNPVLRSMFSAAQTKLDMAKEMDAGRVIIINNSKSILGDEGAEFFGRFFIALILRAAQQRAAKPPSSKKPCYVYIDECQSVISKDLKIPTLIDECRSQKIALILAHQRTAQLSPPVLDAVANCAIRMANSDDEAKYLSPKLRMDAEVLQSLPRGTFGMFVRDLTPQGIQLKVSKVDIDKLPKMTEAEFAAIRSRMNEQFSANSPAAPTTQQQPIQSEPKPDTDSEPAVEDAGEPAKEWK